MRRPRGLNYWLLIIGIVFCVSGVIQLATNSGGFSDGGVEVVIGVAAGLLLWWRTSRN